MTYIRVLQPMDALLSMKMGAGETLHNYANQYWELYNEISEGFQTARLIDVETT